MQQSTVAYTTVSCSRLARPGPERLFIASRSSTQGPASDATLAASDNVAVSQFVENVFGDPLGCRADRRQTHFRRLGRLVGRVDTGEVRNPPGFGIRIK